MPSFHFVVGSPRDILKIDASVQATDADAALAELKQWIHSDINLTPHLPGGSGYAQILVDVDQIGTQHIVRIDPDPIDAANDGAPST